VALGAAVAGLLAWPGAVALHGVPVSEPRPAAARATPAATPGRVVVTQPDRVSFDDLRPGVYAVAPIQPAATLRAAVAPAPRPPRGTVSGALPRPGTARTVLAAAYLKAAGRAPASCHLRAADLAALGQIESGSVGGRTLAGHRVTPAIYGPLLDGGPFTVIRDTDGGRFDGATDYDRAVGPMQFLPGTWTWAGRDGDGDGVRDPQNVFDATLATADYLCRQGRDLSKPAQLRAAFWSYNQSGDYVAAALQWVSYFERQGLAAMDAVAFRVGSGGRASDLTAGQGATVAAATSTPTTTVAATADQVGPPGDQAGPPGDQPSTAGPVAAAPSATSSTPDPSTTPTSPADPSAVPTTSGDIVPSPSLTEPTAPAPPTTPAALSGPSAGSPSSLTPPATP
jgi:hypothetical protein